MVEKLGQFQAVIVPGMTILNPFTQSVTGVVSLRTRSVPIDVHSLTSDNTTVTLTVVVVYRVVAGQASVAYYSLSNPESQISAILENILRNEVTKYTLDALFVAKEAIARSVFEVLGHQLKVYGYDVDDVLISDVRPCPQVIASFNRQVAQRYLRTAQAERAEMEKMQSVMMAEADREVKRLEGIGMSAQRQGITAGLDSLMRRFEGGETTSEMMAMILMQQYFDLLAGSIATVKPRLRFLPPVESGRNAS